MAHATDLAVALADYRGDECTDCINYAEKNYDFGILSQPNTPLGLTYKVDSTDKIFKSFKGSSKSSVQTVDYGVLEAGEHFI